MTDTPSHWYIVQTDSGHCQIVCLPATEAPEEPADTPKRWGPFSSQAEAIARRVGLIRAGKCQPQ